MQFFSEDYLMHYGVKGMKWKKKKKPELPEDITDDAYYEQYPSSWEEAAKMTPEQKKAMREHNKLAKKLRKRYNKQKDKEWKNTQKFLKEHPNIKRPRRRSTDHFTTPSTTGGLYPSSMKPHRVQIHKSKKPARAAGDHPFDRPEPQQDFSRYPRQRKRRYK